MLFTATKGNDVRKIKAKDLYDVLIACKIILLSGYDITLQEDS